MKIGWRRVISNHGIFHSIFAYFKHKLQRKKKLHVKLFNKDNSQSMLYPEVSITRHCVFIAKRMPFALQFLSILVLVFNNKSANSADWHHKILYKVKIMTNDNIF